MNNRASSSYLHGTHSTEQSRLSLLNELLNRKSLNELALRLGERVLDVGSGLGQMSCEMARETSACVIGIERSHDQIASAREYTRNTPVAALVEFRQGDAMSFPLRTDEWGSFDLAHTRFLLEHVNDPLTIVRQMVEAVRSGGRIVLSDDDHSLLRLWPEPPGADLLWVAYQRSYELLGNDPSVGRKLVSLLVDAGAIPVRNTSVFFGSCAGDPNFPLFVDNLIGVIVSARTVIVDAGLIAPDQFDLSVAMIRQWALGPAPAIWYGLSWAEGRRP